MKTLIAIIVYDRYQNVKEWIRCWKQCEHYDESQLVVIQNIPDEIQAKAMEDLCYENEITYIRRENIGMDIGALKDLSQNKLEGIPNIWENLIWITDDTLPMDRRFVKIYLDHLNQPGIGVSCYEMTNEYKTHIRTTGFAIKRETLQKIQFAGSIVTKEDCYQFEHRSKNAFYEQITNMGLRVKQITHVDSSPLWDSGKAKRKSRQKEHDQVFPNEKTTNQKVAIICPIYNQFPMIIGSMLTQTHKDWEMLLIHDGEDTLNIKAYVEFINDHRIKFEISEKVGSYGHPHRQKSLQRLKSGELFPNANYVLITNGDNYHVPTYLEFMLQGFHSENIVASYCSAMIHDYMKHNLLLCKQELGHIDCAGVIVKKDVACDIGWNKPNEHSSDWTYFKEIMQKYGRDNWQRVQGCLLVHN